MRILLTSSASHVPPRGGSTRSNLAWLDALAAGGHTCRVVGGALSTDTPEKLVQVRQELENQHIELASPENYAVADPAKRPVVLNSRFRNFNRIGSWFPRRTSARVSCGRRTMQLQGA